MEPNDKVLIIDCEWDGATVQASVIRHVGGRLLLEIEPTTWESPPRHVEGKVVEFKLLAGSTYVYDSSDTYAAIVPELEAAKVDVSTARVQVHEPSATEHAPSDEDEWEGPTWGGITAFSDADLVDFIVYSERFETADARRLRREELDMKYSRRQLWGHIRRYVADWSDEIVEWREKVRR